MVGIIGLGQMGRGIAKNLDRAGILSAVWDTASASREISFSKGVKFVNGSAMAERCKVILFAVPTSREILSNLTDDEGILAAKTKPEIIVDLTTSHPSKTRELVTLAKAAGCEYLDCGMTGGAIGAASGTLTLMIGGDSKVFERTKPILETFSKRLFLVGPSGAGHVLKLIHNMILHTTFLATCEGCWMAERAGLDLPAVIEVLNAGNARSFISESRFPKHILSRTFDGGSRVSNLAKDLAMALDFAEGSGMSAPYTHLTADLLGRAVDAGLGGDDFTTLYTRLERLIGAEIQRSPPQV